MNSAFDDFLTLEVNHLDVDILTGIYSEETHLPQPLRISIRARLKIADHYEPDTALSRSKNYMDLKH
ncbi:MAG TPA: dihydroneopterin aldolase, partial [Sphingobium sp.]